MNVINKRITCLCGEDKNHIVYQFDNKLSPSNERHFEISNETICKCECCGLLFMNPRKEATEIQDEDAPLMNDFYISQEENRLSTFRLYLRKINSLCPNKGNLLDVGCAAGYFVKVAIDDGWNTMGIDPNKELIDYGKNKFNIPLFNSTLETIKTSQFNVITLWDVIEHVPNPNDILAQCYQLLEKDGLVVINYPNVGSTFVKTFKKKWWFFVSNHLWYFTPKTISELLEKHGFHVIQQKRHFQILSLIYVLQHARTIFPIFFKPIEKVILFLRLGNIPIKYYASQARVIARKT
jgi:SAM-dependent methyltransferase